MNSSVSLKFEDLTKWYDSNEVANKIRNTKKKNRVEKKWKKSPHSIKEWKDQCKITIKVRGSW